MHGAVVTRWGASIPGREAKSLEVFGKALVRFEQLAKDGRIEGHREYFALSGREGGFMVAEGDVAELMTIMAEPESVQLNAQAAAIVEDFEVQVFAGGTDAAVQESMGYFMTGLQEIGYL